MTRSDMKMTIGVGIIVLVIALAGIFSRHAYKPVQHDNPIEEAAEEVIKKATGVDVDLSPETPERKKKSGDAKDACLSCWNDEIEKGGK